MHAVFFHVDLDAFFASVEVLDDPSLVGKPIIVGAAPGHRGVVATCSYAARAFGVHSAMPINEAWRLCPTAVFLPPRMERYVELSRAVMAIFGDFTPDVLVVSIDEAFLDMTGTERLFGPPVEAARRLKDRVRSETGLTLSVGVAANRYVAKVASGMSKPDGLTVVEPGAEVDFMAKVPIGRLWGAGEKTQARFRELGIASILQLRALGPAALTANFGASGGEFLHKTAFGIDPGIYAGEAESRSMSTERTFERDVTDAATLEAVLLGMADELAYRAYREGLRSRTCVLKLRFHDFVTITRRVTADTTLRTSDDIVGAAYGLFRARPDSGAVRLIGLGLANLERGDLPEQGELFDDAGRKRRRFERAVFGIEERGLGRVKRARLIKPGDEQGPDR